MKTVGAIFIAESAPMFVTRVGVVYCCDDDNDTPISGILEGPDCKSDFSDY